MNAESPLIRLVLLLGLVRNSTAAQPPAAASKLPYDRTCPVIYDNDYANDYVDWYLMALAGHETRIGDVDGDGDIDLVSKSWVPSRRNAVGGKIHVDFIENLLHQEAR